METRIIKNKISRAELESLIHNMPEASRVSKERWETMSLAEQLGNIGSEVGRAAKWQNKDEKTFWGAVTRALHLFDLTQRDSRWKNRRMEIDRARETFADAVLGGGEYQSNLKSLEEYFMPFAIAAQMQSLSNAKKVVLGL